MKTTLKGNKHRIIAHELSLGEGKVVTIRSNTKPGLLFLRCKRHPNGKVTKGVFFLSRNGSMDMTGELNAFGEEWQV